MDRIARAIYELKFAHNFNQKRGSEFEDFFADIMEMAHPADFQRTRSWGREGDLKCDGYLKSEKMVFQVYAPNEITAKQTINKINEDFHGALSHWSDSSDLMNHWVFVHNSRSGLSGSIIKHLLELEKTSSCKVSSWGKEELRLKAFELSSEDLANLLGHVPTHEDIVNLGLECLAPVLDHIGGLPHTNEPDLRPPPADKISRNQLSQSVETLLKAGMSKSRLVKQYFTLYPGRLDEISQSFNNHYLGLRNKDKTPEEIFSELQEFAGGTHQSPTKQCAVLAVLAYLFEECDIFERKTGDEE